MAPKTPPLYLTTRCRGAHPDESAAEPWLRSPLSPDLPPSHLTTRCRGAHPDEGAAEPLSSSARRKACRTKGFTSASAAPVGSTLLGLPLPPPLPPLPCPATLSSADGLPSDAASEV